VDARRGTGGDTVGVYYRDYYRQHHKAPHQPFTFKAASRFPLVRVPVQTVFYCVVVYGSVRLVPDVAKILR